MASDRRRTCPRSRRAFLRSMGIGAAAIGTGTWLSDAPAAAPSQVPAGPVTALAPHHPGRVVEVLGAQAMAGGRASQDRVAMMVERGLIELTGAPSLTAAWKQFVGPGDVVGLKVNTLSGAACSTRHELVSVVVRGLTLAGVRESDIVIWDRFESHLRRARYTIQQRPGALRCYATDSPGAGGDLEVYYAADVRRLIPESMTDETAHAFAGAYPNSHFSAIFTRHITKQINLPVLKDHNITGMTLSLKNVAFGICGNTERFHPTPINCDPMIGEVCAHPMIRSKNVLNIADCLNLIVEGGPIVDPQHLVEYGALLFGTDPVAVDTVGLDILEQLRAARQLPSLWKTSSPPKYLGTAARLALGVGDRRTIDHRTVRVPA